MTLPISYFRFYVPEYVLKTRLPPNCATGFFDRLGIFLVCIDTRGISFLQFIYREADKMATAIS